MLTKMNLKDNNNVVVWRVPGSVSDLLVVGHRHFSPFLKLEIVYLTQF